MSNKAAISLATGLEDAEKVTVALLVAVGAAESGRSTLMFVTKEAVRLALTGTAVGTACDGCPSIPDLMARYAAADGRLLAWENGADRGHWGGDGLSRDLSHAYAHDGHWLCLRRRGRGTPLPNYDHDHHQKEHHD